MLQNKKKLKGANKHKKGMKLKGGPLETYYDITKKLGRKWPLISLRAEAQLGGC